MPRRSFYLVVLWVLILLVSCRQDASPTLVPTVVSPPGAAATQPAIDTSQSTAPAPATATPTAIPATATPSEPLAALVNGRPVFLSSYEKELSRYEQAQTQLGLTPDEQTVDYRTLVLDGLIETELISQAAEEFGLSVTLGEVDARLAELEELSGGPDKFAEWLQTNQMTQEEFREALVTEMLTEKMIEQVTAAVPLAVEQVNARYIQVDDPVLAQSLLDQVRSGADFASLAVQYSLDRVTGESGGDLGFFAQGSLLVPEVETAAFNLQPGEVSEVVAGTRADGSGTTYYLVQVLEIDPQRQLTADLLYVRLQETFEGWLAERETQADIIRYVDTGTG